MTQEEKAKAYDEAINRMKHYVIDEYGCSRIKVADVFPELKESEDERIRKVLLNNFKNNYSEYCCDGVNRDMIIAWLEKQGEQKPTAWSEENETSIAINNPDAYRIGFADGEAHAKEEMTTAWSEEDELLIRELESLVKQVWAIAEHENDKDTIHKMSDLSFFLKTLKPQLKQEWSEEDESKRKFIEDELSCLIADEREIESPLTKRVKDLYSALYWFESIKDRYTWKPSDEQIEYLAKAITTLGDEGDCKTASILNDLRVELKKLREE